MVIVQPRLTPRLLATSLISAALSSFTSRSQRSTCLKRLGSSSSARSSKRGDSRSTQSTGSRRRLEHSTAQFALPAPMSKMPSPFSSHSLCSSEYSYKVEMCRFGG